MVDAMLAYCAMTPSVAERSGPARWPSRTRSVYPGPGVLLHTSRIELDSSTTMRRTGNTSPLTAIEAPAVESGSAEEGGAPRDDRREDAAATPPATNVSRRRPAISAMAIRFPGPLPVSLLRPTHLPRFKWQARSLDATGQECGSTPTLSWVLARILSGHLASCQCARRPGTPPRSYQDTATRAVHNCSNALSFVL